MSETLNKGKLGEIGENLVQTKLMQLGLNVINANTIMANYESVDLICVKPGNKKKVYVQVKTHKGHNFPIGITLAKCTRDYLEGKIKGPWVFVHATGEGADMNFHYYVLTKEEMIDTTMIYSAKGLLKERFTLINKRPFRAPSLVITAAGMFGGGIVPKPGEISLAHHGVLFLDEFPEYAREIIEMFRIPLENHSISVIRQERTLIFPADFLFIIAANACPCGYYPMDKCRCTSRQILRYQNRISGPILDRMDLFVRCEEIGYDVLTASSKEESSSSIQKRVSAAWVIQKERFAESSTIFNGRMTKSEVEQYCQLDAEGQRLMKKAYSAFSLTGRSYFKILKTARTIADLEQSPDIRARHLEEALYFRQKEKGNLNER